MALRMRPDDEEQGGHPAKKVIGKSLEDERKTKHGTHSAGLSREQILASQARHKEKMEALGKQVQRWRDAQTEAANARSLKAQVDAKLAEGQEGKAASHTQIGETYDLNIEDIALIEGLMM